MYKLLLIRNRYTKPLDFKKGLEWFINNTPIKVHIVDEISTDFELTSFQIKNATYKGVIAGEDLYPKLRAVIPEGKYHAVIFVYGNKLDGIRVSAAPYMPLYAGTDLIQLVKLNDNGKALNHEIFHTFFHRLQRQQIAIEDPMDAVVYNGELEHYFRNDNLNAKPSNRTIALERISPHWDKIKNILVLTPTNNMENYFKTQEFVSKTIYTQWGEKALWFIDPRIRKLANFTRKFFNKPVTINNWHTGGAFDQRGFREPESTVGAKLSQHRFGRAIDINVSGMTSNQVYDTILANEKVFMDAGLTCLEDKVDTVSWTHLDCRYTGLDKILIVKP